MAGRLKEKITGQLRAQAKLLQSGKKPKPWLENATQRTALRLLAGFMAIMLAFTLISRAANAATIALVQAETIKSGSLTDRAVISGEIMPQGDWILPLPQGVRIENVSVKAGQSVKTGDVLLTLEAAELSEQILLLQKSNEILKLKISASYSGISSDGMESVLAAQRALEDAKYNYESLVQSLERGEKRSEEDYTEAQQALSDAEKDLEKIIQKTKENLIEAAEGKVQNAKESLEEAKLSAEDAIRSAQQALSLAADSEDVAYSAYQRARDAYNAAKSAREAAQARLDELESAAAPDEAAIAAAREELESAKNAETAAKQNLDAQSDYGSSAYSNAQENLKVTKERCEKSIEKAQNTLNEAESELSKARERSDFSDEPSVISAQSALDTAQRALKTMQREMEDSDLSAEDELRRAKRAVDSAQSELSAAERKAAEGSANSAAQLASAEIDRLTYQSELLEKEKQLQVLEAAAENGGAVLSPISASVLTVPEKGSVTDDKTLLSLSQDERGFSFTGSLDGKSAARLAVGDTGRLSYTIGGKQSFADVTISSISAPDSEGKSEISAILPSGSYPSGAIAELSITKKSETYYSCLPLSALRSGSQGDYVLVLRERQTVLGTEMTVEEIPISVEARDSEIMSVSGALAYDDRVVFSSSKPISEGDRVRLEDS